MPDPLGLAAPRAGLARFKVRRFEAPRAGLARFEGFEAFEAFEAFEGFEGEHPAVSSHGKESLGLPEPLGLAPEKGPLRLPQLPVLGSSKSRFGSFRGV